MESSCYKMTIKKMITSCPACNSTKLVKSVVEGEVVLKCLKCGYLNKVSKEKNSELKW